MKAELHLKPTFTNDDVARIANVIHTAADRPVGDIARLVLDAVAALPFTVKVELPDDGDAFDPWEAIEALCADEASSVTILADNAGPGGPNAAVICNGDWTGWEDVRFAADDIFQALKDARLYMLEFRAVEARRKEPPAAPADTNGARP